uniref:RRM domain-containing protein n=1 Tax=Araucaria cunninghamii TaxID=56994 RepID=A0A0D6R0P6_ARACU
MANALDMSLDDLIKTNKQTAGGGRGRGGGRGGRRRGGGGGGFGRGGRRGPLSVNRPSPYSIAKSFSRAKNVIWQHDIFEDNIVAVGMPAGPDSGTKLYISNLDAGVTNSDIKELFGEVGELKRCAVHYDRSGRSNGTAEVVYINKNDAIAAVKRYNNVQLDGKPMKIELIGSNLSLPMAARVNVTGTPAGRGRRTVVMTPGFTRAAADASIDQRGNGWNRGRGYGSRRFRGRGRGRRGRGRSQAPEKSAADLDKELENYHAEAMQTS